MAHEEYTSNDDDEDTSGEGMATATMAIATSSPSKVSLFGAPNENLIAKCLMAKGINKVTSNIKTTITTTPSLLHCVDDSEVVKVDENEFDKFLNKLKGETKKHFVPLLEQLGEASNIIESHEDTISKLEGIVMTMPTR